MKVGIWVSGKLNAHTLMNWARKEKHEVKCLISMDPKDNPLQWASLNMDTLKEASDTSGIDLLFKSVKKTGEDNLKALDALLQFAKKKYNIEAVVVTPKPAIAHPIRNSARKFKLKTLLLPK